MAKAKKKAPKKKAPSKPAKKPAPKSSKAAPARARAARAQPAGLTTDDKQRLLKPGPDYDAVLAVTLPAWKSHSRYVRVADLSAARLGSTARKAGRAWEKERAFRAKMDAKLQPLMDARMRLEDEVMRGMLDLNAEVKSTARRRPEVADAFAALADFCARGGRPSGGGDAGPPAPPAAT